MKKYETPRVSFEAFAADNAFAASCPGINEKGEITFSCMRGPQLDKANVVHDDLLADVCTTQAGYKSIWYDEDTQYSGVINFNTQAGHSANTDYYTFSDSDVDNNGKKEVMATFTETAKETMVGFLYYCTSFASCVSSWVDYWVGDKVYWAHTGTSGNDKHVMIGAVWSSNINS